MNPFIALRKRRTILISISILLVSLHTIYFYNVVVPEVETKKIIQQVIRFLLTVGLLFMVYKGKNWARIISLILFTIGCLGAIIGLFGIDKDITLKIPFMVMIFVYSVAIYHFGFSTSFKAFASYQNGEIN